MKTKEMKQLKLLLHKELDRLFNKMLKYGHKMDKLGTLDMSLVQETPSGVDETKICRLNVEVLPMKNFDGTISWEVEERIIIQD